jgi:hypothetical protein
MKSRFGLVSVGALAMVVAGCAGGSAVRAADAPQSGWGGSEPAAAPPAESPSDFASQPPAAATPHEEAERSPAQRPGLGTEWGETRYSQVHEVPFVRAADDPFAVAALRYDDRSGIDRVADHHGPSRWVGDVAIAGGGIMLGVRGEHGEALDTLRLGDRTYVVGRAGERYSIVLSNRTSRRIEAVATVDGLDVINGQTGALSNRGYLLEPRATLEIDGFRKSDDTVAAFRFGRVADSYAAQTGSARDVGVIGVAFFAERGDDARERELRLRDTANPFPGEGRYAQPPL